MITLMLLSHLYSPVQSKYFQREEMCVCKKNTDENKTHIPSNFLGE